MPSLDVVRESAMATDLHQEIEALPMRYDSELGERGVNLSGGQKQRLTLARAIIRKTPVVIFDDSLSSVDAETEHRLVEQLEKTVEDRHHGGRTTIIISHRLASLKSAQRVVVFKNGEIEAVGNQEELLETSPTYQKLFGLQTYQKGSEENESHPMVLRSPSLSPKAHKIKQSRPL